MRYVLAFGFRNQYDCEMFRHPVFLRVSFFVVCRASLSMEPPSRGGPPSPPPPTVLGTTSSLSAPAAAHAAPGGCAPALGGFCYKRLYIMSKPGGARRWPGAICTICKLSQRNRARSAEPSNLLELTHQQLWASGLGLCRRRAVSRDPAKQLASAV